MQDTLRKMIYKLIEKIDNKVQDRKAIVVLLWQALEDSQRFYLFKILRAHILPLTNCAFNKHLGMDNLIEIQALLVSEVWVKVHHRLIRPNVQSLGHPGLSLTL